MPSEVREISVEEANKAAPNGIGREAAESTATSTELGVGWAIGFAYAGELYWEWGLEGFFE
jgi:hypothetical protein